MVYPHLPTMLVSDPTEAIHAELIMPVLRRYFEIEHFRALGGGWRTRCSNLQHGRLARRTEAARGGRAGAGRRRGAGPMPTRRAGRCSAYVVARPRRAALSDAEQLAVWTAEEGDRERLAAAAGGRYYPDTFLSGLYEDLDQAKRGRAGATAERDAALARLGHGPPVPASCRRCRRRRAGPAARNRAGARTAAKRVPGARPAVLALRRWRAARAAR